MTSISSALPPPAGLPASWTRTQRSGFGTGENLCKVFRRLVGIGPEQYRQRYTTSDNRHGTARSDLV